MDGRKTHLWLDWTRLNVGDEVQITESASSYNSIGAQKSYNYHQKGLKTSFDHGSDLSVFQTALMRKLWDTSLDTITNMLHPKDLKDMVSIYHFSWLNNYQ
jgi:hypothetical protein